MGLFKRKKEEVAGLIGLDIGAGGVKLVELVRKDKKLTLSTYATARPKEMKEGQTVHDFFKDTKAAADMLQSLLKAAGVQQKRVNIAIPSHVVFHAMITLPVPTKPGEDLRPQVEMRVKPLLPLPIEEMVIDSVVVDKHLLPKAALSFKKKEKEVEDDSSIAQFAALQSGEGMAEAAGAKPAFIRVLVSGSPKTLVDQYVEIGKRANLELVALETESFALIRSLVGNDKAKIMIVDIGEDRTNLTIVQQGLPFLHRSIQVGGNSITKEFMRRLNVDQATAEQIKRDLAQDPTGEPPEAITAILDPILHEIRYSLQLFAEQDFHNQTTVDKLILAGGSSHIPYLDPILTNAIKVNVYVGNPWARVMTPPAMRQALDDNGPQFAVAIGLAMKE